MSALNSQFLISLALILTGYFCKRISLVTEKDGEIISRLILNITLPALVLVTFSSIDISLSLSLLPFLCIISGLLISGMAFFIFKNSPAPFKGILMASSCGFNIGLFAYPLIEGIFGVEGLQYIAMFDMGNAVLIFGLSYSYACYYAPGAAAVNYREIAARLLKFFPLLSYLLALGISISGLQLPVLISGFLAPIAGANSFLALFLLGVYLNFTLSPKHWQYILKLLSLRYVFGLAAGITVYCLLLPYETFNQVFKSIALMGFILPVGMSVVPYAIQFNYDKKLTGAIVNISNIISFFLIWVLLALTN